MSEPWFNNGCTLKVSYRADWIIGAAEKEIAATCISPKPYAEFREQLAQTIPTNQEEATLRRLAQQSGAICTGIRKCHRFWQAGGVGRSTALAHLYGLTYEEFRYIFLNFPLVKAED
jgi:hypothetical protein